MKRRLFPQFILAVMMAISAYSLVKSNPTTGQASWPEISLIEITSGLVSPTHVTNASDESGRLFIVEQAGIIKIYRNTLLSIPFLDIKDRVRSPSNGGGGEEGLLSVAFPPGYGTDKDYFYVYYTRLDGDNQVSRFHLTSNPDIADSNSEESILLLHHPVNSNHNGGQLAFGPDGYLYIGTGDGGGSNDPGDNAQDLTSLLGKILRINVERNQYNGITGNHITYLPVINSSINLVKYQIPPDNPFIDNAEARDEIWSYGLRNPWRFSFDHANGDLFIGDVGQGKWEEVNYQAFNSSGGENYGWDIYEGFDCVEPPCQSAGLIFPIHTYPNEINFPASITGGFVYRGKDYPDLKGIYFYADFFTDKLHGLKYESGEWRFHKFNTGEKYITSFGEDGNGELFFVSRNPGSLYRIATAP